MDVGQHWSQHGHGLGGRRGDRAPYSWRGLRLFQTDGGLGDPKNLITFAQGGDA